VDGRCWGWCAGSSPGHTVAIFAQPVFAGSYLVGDYDMLALHYGYTTE
jgi:hypothetical protein